MIIVRHSQSVGDYVPLRVIDCIALNLLWKDVNLAKVNDIIPKDFDLERATRAQEEYYAREHRIRDVEIRANRNLIVAVFGLSLVVLKTVQMYFFR